MLARYEYFLGVLSSFSNLSLINCSKILETGILSLFFIFRRNRNWFLGRLIEVVSLGGGLTKGLAMDILLYT